MVSPLRLSPQAQTRNLTVLDSLDIENYADKYKTKTNLTTTSLDAQALGLEKSFFPERMWATYFDPNRKLKGAHC
jgi:hypothetical protein